MDDSPLLKRGLLILLLLVTLILPAAATDPVHLDAGLFCTTYRTFPNQMGFDNATIYNLTQFTTNASWNLSAGSLMYPPVYETNTIVVPWEIWILILAIGIVSLLFSFEMPTSDGKLPLAVLSMAFISFSYILSPFIGQTDLAVNPQLIQPWSAGPYMLVTVAQPTITIYSPPYLWVFMLIMLALSIAGIASGVWSLFAEGVKPIRRVER